MNIAERAFTELYPEKDVTLYNLSVSYSGRFSPYNGHIKYLRNNYSFQISKLWKGVSDEIQIGLLQHLLQKALKTKRKTLNQDLYHSFIKNVHIAVPKNKVEPELQESFDRVNDQYFLGMVEMPNLVFGKKSFRKLGSYEYASDTITMSLVFKNISLQDRHLLDYVMFHEMLHKVHKFKTVNGRSFHHTPVFKKAEQQYENFDDMESQLAKFLRKKKVKNYFGID
ncbi:MAG: hypothetical protein ACMXYE_00560 [Candidatus Woesearchaeota archaeon]